MKWGRINFAGDNSLGLHGVVRTGFIEGAIFAALISSSATIGLAGSAAFIAGLTTAATIGLSVGLSYLSSRLFAPRQPKPEDVQTSIKNPTAARQRHYGRVKTSGPWAFGESKEGSFHKVIVTGTGELDAIEEIWVDDAPVTLDINGYVQEHPWNYDGKWKHLRIQYRMGLPTETHYSDLGAVFPEWDASHRGDGVSSLYAFQGASGAETFAQIFPNVTNTLYRVVARGSKVWNPVTETVAWSDNAAAIVRDYMGHADGMRLPDSLFSTPIAAEGWKRAFNRAAAPVALKAGGTEPAWRLWGSYRFDERPADVLGRMLPCCDGWLVPTPDGGVTLDINEWQEPTVILDDDAIVGFSDVSRGRDIMTTANIIAATFLSPDHDYQATDAEAWVDSDDVDERGEIISPAEFNMAPSHGQCRRLMKRAYYRANPKWVGQFRCNLRGLAAFGKRRVRIRYPLFGIDDAFEVQDFRFNLGEGGILLGCTLQVASMPAEAFSWDAAAEEGEAPIAEETNVESTIPVPADLSFGVTRITVGNQQVPLGVITFARPANRSLKVDGRYKQVSASDWTVIPIGDDATEAQTGALSDGVQYEAQIRYSQANGRQGEWSASEYVTPVADPTAPAIVEGVDAVGGTGAVSVSWTAPNSPNYVAAHIRRNTSNVESGAPVRVEYGPPSLADSWSDTGLAAGDYYYWIRAANASGVESVPVAVGPITVT
ncbi:hypothetical protein HNR59_002865 [Aquamicrobium lusatiense]|uniref:Fibronectin type-III domain-containing protein n=1 Tax=Aquamicrobium lusatiense TaxID=89772 RepID=A0A7W9S3L5_9HYPH|nr:fibronectin type III domain-containing protein [Aquamicrobium lusatiense]MBB6013476.1 hypothetical protein [Aquamicrobium lusatiense]